MPKSGFKKKHKCKLKFFLNVFGSLILRKTCLCFFSKADLFYIKYIQACFSVCLSVCPIITHKPLDQFSSNRYRVRLESREYSNLNLKNCSDLQAKLDFQASVIYICSKYSNNPIIIETWTYIYVYVLLYLNIVSWI